MFLADPLIFNKSVIYFSSDISDISECWREVKDYPNTLQIDCYLRQLKAKSTDGNLEYNRTETIFKGYVTNNLNYREKIKPFTIGIGVINNEDLKVQLLPSYQSANTNITTDIVGTKIMVKVLEELLMKDL